MNVPAGMSTISICGTVCRDFTRDVVLRRVGWLDVGCGDGLGLGATTPPFSCVPEISPFASFTLNNDECGKISARMINKINIKQALKGWSFILVAKHTIRPSAHLTLSLIRARGKKFKGY